MTVPQQRIPRDGSGEGRTHNPPEAEPDNMAELDPKFVDLLDALDLDNLDALLGEYYNETNPLDGVSPDAAPNFAEASAAAAAAAAVGEEREHFEVVPGGTVE